MASADATAGVSTATANAKINALMASSYCEEYRSRVMPDNAWRFQARNDRTHERGRSSQARRSEEAAGERGRQLICGFDSEEASIVRHRQGHGGAQRSRGR